MTQNDPLRFLKPRKKQFHLTPTKNYNKNNDISSQLHIVKQSLRAQYNSHTQVLRNQHQVKQGDLTFVLKSTQQQTKQGHTKVEGKSFFKHSNPQYNPLKYFSQAVQDFLNKKSSQPQQKSQRTGPTFNGLKNTLDNQSSLNNQIQRQVNGKTNHNYLKEDSNIKSCLNQPLNSVRIIEKYHLKPSIPEPQQSKEQYLVQHKNMVQESNEQYLNKNQESDQTEEQQSQSENKGQGLKKCEICGRSFNPSSYEKHVRVCQKVFFKKRKEFSSEKQRSLSKKK